MVVRCTNKMIETYKIKLTGNAIEDEFYSWHSHVFYIYGKKSIILMNDETRFCIVLFDITKSLFDKSLLNLWANYLCSALLEFNIPKKQIDQYIMKSLIDNEIIFTKTTNRSVITHINCG